MENEVVLKKYEDKFDNEVGEIAILAWTPLRQVAKNELGDEIYDTIFKNWQANKRKSVLVAMKTDDGHVAMIGDKVVGFISYKVNGVMGVVGENAVHPDFKEKGIAQKMYALVLDKMKEHGAEIATVFTGLDEGHAPARRAYERAGFKQNLKHITYYKVLK